MFEKTLTCLRITNNIPCYMEPRNPKAISAVIDLNGIFKHMDAKLFIMRPPSPPPCIDGISR